MERRQRGVKIVLKDGSGVVFLKYLKEDVDRHGNVRIYYRRNGKKFRLRAEFGTQAFLEEYYTVAATLKPQPQKPVIIRGSLRWLMQEYFGSAEFAALSERTRYVRRLVLEEICGVRTQSGVANGDKPYALMEARNVRILRDAVRDRPEAANQRVKFLRQLFKWAIEIKNAKANPARDVAYFSPSSEGFHTWTIEEVWKYAERHPIGTKARLAMDLLLFTGVRRSDAVKMGPHMESAAGDVIRWTEEKGRRRKVKHRELPILPQLRASIDATETGPSAYLVTTYGKPFTHAGFGNWFRDRCNEAGLQNCSAHGLRKAGATIAADNGATEYELMAIFGWETAKEAARYTRHANRKKLAANALRLVAPAAPAQKVNPFGPPLSAPIGPPPKKQTKSKSK